MVEGVCVRSLCFYNPPCTHTHTHTHVHIHTHLHIEQTYLPHLFECWDRPLLIAHLFHTTLQPQQLLRLPFLQRYIHIMYIHIWTYTSLCTYTYTCIYTLCTYIHDRLTIIQSHVTNTNQGIDIVHKCCDMYVSVSMYVVTCEQE